MSDSKAPKDETSVLAHINKPADKGGSSDATQQPQAFRVYVVEEEFRGDDDSRGQRILGIFRTLAAANQYADSIGLKISRLTKGEKSFAEWFDDEYYSFKHHQKTDEFSKKDDGGGVWAIEYGDANGKGCANVVMVTRYEVHEKTPGGVETFVPLFYSTGIGETL
jgi:hypothetical protein